MAELEHGPECDCGCNDEPNPTITLEFDDGESLLCEALFVFEVDGKEYSVIIDGISAKDMDELVTIKPFYTDENGERVYGEESTLGVGVWVYGKMTSTSTSATALKDKAFAPALGNYVYNADLRFS